MRVRLLEKHGMTNERSDARTMDGLDASTKTKVMHLCMEQSRHDSVACDAQPFRMHAHGLECYQSESRLHVSLVRRREVLTYMHHES